MKSRGQSGEKVERTRGKKKAARDKRTDRTQDAEERERRIWYKVMMCQNTRGENTAAVLW